MTRRLAGAMLAFTAIVLLVSVLPLGLATTARDRRDYRAGTADLARSLATLADEAFDKRIGALTSARLTAAVGDDAGAVVIDRNGAVVVTGGTPFTPPPNIVRRVLAGHPIGGTTPNGDDAPVAAAPVTEGALVEGAVIVVRSEHPVDQRVTRLWLALGGLAAAALLLAFALAVALARWVGRPIRGLESTAHGWADGHLDRRASVAGGPPELRELAETFNAMAGRLEALLHGSRAVVADVSHQLRTPLAAVRLRLELMRGEIGDSADEDLVAALAEIDRLSRLVDGLLAVARAENAVVAPVSVDMTGLVAERRQAWQPVADERGIVIELDEQMPDVNAAATPGHLEQVLDNLIANAIEAVQPGGRIGLELTLSGGRVMLRVVDNGVGMSAEQREQAFRRFVSGRGGEGAGLGLAIVHRLVTSDGGSVHIEDTPGGGTTVVLDLPAARSPAQASR
jgi:signal transduction histidine kinase